MFIPVLNINHGVPKVFVYCYVIHAFLYFISELMENKKLIYIMIPIFSFKFIFVIFIKKYDKLFLLHGIIILELYKIIGGSTWKSNSTYVRNVVIGPMNQINFKQQEEISQNYLIYKIKSLLL